MEDSYFPEHINTGYFCNWIAIQDLLHFLLTMHQYALIIYHNHEFGLRGAVNASEVVYSCPALPGMIMILTQPICLVGWRWTMKYNQLVLIQDLNLVPQGIDQVHGNKDCPKCVIPVPTMIGSKENLWFPDTLMQCLHE